MWTVSTAVSSLSATLPREQDPRREALTSLNTREDWAISECLGRGFAYNEGEVKSIDGIKI